MNHNEEDKKTTPGLSLKVWLRLTKYFKLQKKELIWAGIVIVLVTGLFSAFPLFTRYAIDNFVVPATTEGIVPFALLYISFILIGGVCIIFWCKLLMTMEMRIGKFIRRDCFVHLQKLQISYHNVNSVGYLIGRVMSDTERICGMISWGFSFIIEASLIIVFSVTFMLILNPMLALVLIIIIPVAGLIAWIFQRKILRESGRGLIATIFALMPVHDQYNLDTLPPPQHTLLALLRNRDLPPIF